MNSAVLSAEGITKKFGRTCVLDGVTFKTFPGTMVGIAGENGSGKTTLLRILAGVLTQTSGKVEISDRLGYCPQEAVLNETLTPRQHLEYFAAAYCLADIKYALSLVETLGFNQYIDKPVSELSGGTKQKLNLALALMHRPGVLLLDEPYQGFDWETYLKFWAMADELKGQGCCLLVISHLLYDKDKFDTIYKLHEGNLLLEKGGPVAT